VRREGIECLETDERGTARRENETDSGEQPDVVFLPHCVGVFQVVIRAVPRVGAVAIGGWGGQQEVGRDGAAGGCAGDGGAGHEESERERRHESKRAATTSKIINVRGDQSRRRRRSKQSLHYIIVYFSRSNSVGHPTIQNSNSAVHVPASWATR
jgi:hypothetical protein